MPSLLTKLNSVNNRSNSVYETYKSKNMSHKWQDDDYYKTCISSIVMRFSTSITNTIIVDITANKKAIYAYIFACVNFLST